MRLIVAIAAVLCSSALTIPTVTQAEGVEVSAPRA